MMFVRQGTAPRLEVAYLRFYFPQSFLGLARDKQVARANAAYFVMPEAAEIAGLLGFGPVRTWLPGRALALCCGDGQPLLRYSGLVQNRHRFPQAHDTNDRWDSLRTTQKAVPSGHATGCDRTVRPDQHRRAAASSRAQRRTAVPVRRL